MIIWITGGAGSGKSSLAQDLAAALAAGGPLYYVATMVPRDEEDRRRITRHIEDRSGMGFKTIECACRLAERVTPDPEGTYLLDSATAMLSNAMFGEKEFVYDPDAALHSGSAGRFFFSRSRIRRYTIPTRIRKSSSARIHQTTPIYGSPSDVNPNAPAGLPQFRKKYG